MSQDALNNENFDWVSARANCSPFSVLQKLRLQIEDDIAKRKALMSDAEKSNFKFDIAAEGRRFSVTVEGKLQFFKGVTFSPTSTGIAVHGAESRELLYEGILTLSNNGECKLRVGDTEYSFWQFRKLALEDVLFTSIGRP